MSSLTSLSFERGDSPDTPGLTLGVLETLNYDNFALSALFHTTTCAFTKQQAEDLERDEVVLAWLATPTGKKEKIAEINGKPYAVVIETNQLGMRQPLGLTICRRPRLVGGLFRASIDSDWFRKGMAFEKFLQSPSGVQMIMQMSQDDRKRMKQNIGSLNQRTIESIRNNQLQLNPFGGPVQPVVYERLKEASDNLVRQTANPELLRERTAIQNLVVQSLTNPESDDQQCCLDLISMGSIQNDKTLQTTDEGHQLIATLGDTKIDLGVRVKAMREAAKKSETVASHLCFLMNQKVMDTALAVESICQLVTAFYQAKDNESRSAILKDIEKHKNGMPREGEAFQNVDLLVKKLQDCSSVQEGAAKQRVINEATQLLEIIVGHMVGKPSVQNSKNPNGSVTQIVKLATIIAKAQAGDYPHSSDESAEEVKE